MTASPDTATLPNERTVTITRLFDAPRPLVFSMWTEPKHMARWWGPRRFDNPVCELDARPGGKILIHMRAPDGFVHPMTGIFHEVVAPERLVFTAFAEDKQGNRLIEAPTTVTFVEEDRKTRVTVHARGIGLASIAPQMLAGMHEGWSQSLEKLAELVAQVRQTDRANEAEAHTQGEMCMKAEPQKEHQWLQKLVGDWRAEMECVMGPDQEPMKSKGTETVRSLGGLWTVGEGKGETPDGSPATMLMTLGYDPQKQRFVGTFVASMMTHLWRYEGSLDAAGRVLTLDTEGPSMAGNGMTKYQDMIEFRNDDHRVLTSRALGEDGQWRQFMEAHYRRVK